MANFDRLDRMMSASVDRLMSVAATITPRLTTANGRGIADPDRSELQCVGVLSTVSEDAKIETGNRDRKGNSTHSLATGNRIEFSVDITRYPEAAQAQQGDILTTDDATKYRITGIEFDGLSRAVLVLSR
ncbi:hypothetical protein [Roseibium sp.]|uniref:hypothetical protein n=1 Tax=Roseibium sp. TaxID=1936156 RepID=UPI003918B053